MNLSKSDKKRLRSWKEGECYEGNNSDPGNKDAKTPMLPKVCFSIINRHMHKAKTARGKLKRAAKAIAVILDFLGAINNHDALPSS